MISPSEVYFLERLLEHVDYTRPQICCIDNVAPRSQFSQLVSVDGLVVLFELLKLQESSTQSPKIMLFKYNLAHEEYSRYSAFLALFAQYIGESEVLSVRVQQKGVQMFTAASVFFKAAKPGMWLRPKVLLNVGEKWVADVENLLPYARSYWFQIGKSVLAVGGDCGGIALTGE